jgi:hypothetical protein
MRLALLASLFALGCGGGGGSTPAPDLSVAPDLASNHDLAGNADLTPGLPTLTVDNTSAWCDVTVTVGNDAPVLFATTSKAFTAAAGTAVTLKATPHPGFIQVVWTGTKTMNGDSATYTMSADAVQTVTACCPFANGTGC